MVRVSVPIARSSRKEESSATSHIPLLRITTKKSATMKKSSRGSVASKSKLSFLGGAGLTKAARLRLQRMGKLPEEDEDALEKENAPAAPQPPTKGTLRSERKPASSEMAFAEETDVLEFKEDPKALQDILENRGISREQLSGFPKVQLRPPTGEGVASSSQRLRHQSAFGGRVSGIPQRSGSSLFLRKSSFGGFKAPPNLGGGLVRPVFHQEVRRTSILKPVNCSLVAPNSPMSFRQPGSALRYSLAASRLTSATRPPPASRLTAWGERAEMGSQPLRADQETILKSKPEESGRTEDGPSTSVQATGEEEEEDLFNFAPLPAVSKKTKKKRRTSDFTRHFAQLSPGALSSCLKAALQLHDRSGTPDDFAEGNEAGPSGGSEAVAEGTVPGETELEEAAVVGRLSDISEGAEAGSPIGLPSVAPGGSAVPRQPTPPSSDDGSKAPLQDETLLLPPAAESEDAAEPVEDCGPKAPGKKRSEAGGRRSGVMTRSRAKAAESPSPLIMLDTYATTATPKAQKDPKKSVGGSAVRHIPQDPTSPSVRRLESGRGRRKVIDNFSILEAEDATLVEEESNVQAPDGGRTLKTPRAQRYNAKAKRHQEEGRKAEAEDLICLDAMKSALPVDAPLKTPMALRTASKLKEVQRSPRRKAPASTPTSSEKLLSVGKGAKHLEESGILSSTVAGETAELVSFQLSPIGPPVRSNLQKTGIASKPAAGKPPAAGLQASGAGGTADLHCDEEVAEVLTRKKRRMREGDGTDSALRPTDPVARQLTHGDDTNFLPIPDGSSPV